MESRFRWCGKRKSQEPRRDAAERRPDHVVVFVHGMGKALKGGTLQEWAQPLTQSLNDLSLDMSPADAHRP